MTRAIGIILLLASAVAIFLIARQYPFSGTVVFEFQEVWLWIVLVVVILLAGIGGYLAFRRRALTRYD
jgi:Na+-transporting NADH:ubiquinone oxidoreductase subunit NqrE